jgi:hypothetical protein
MPKIRLHVDHVASSFKENQALYHVLSKPLVIASVQAVEYARKIIFSEIV